MEPAWNLRLNNKLVDEKDVETDLSGAAVIRFSSTLGAVPAGSQYWDRGDSPVLFAEVRYNVIVD